eukprot:1156823-Pelagomonas_calceolata.AAC.4
MAPGSGVLQHTPAGKGPYWQQLSSMLWSWLVAWANARAPRGRRRGIGPRSYQGETVCRSGMFQLGSA